MSAKKKKSSRHPADDPFAADVPLSDAIAPLALAVPAVPPPSPAVKTALLARIRAAKNETPSPAGWRFSALDSGEGWIPLPIPGVRMRQLTLDRERDTALIYVEMAPGAVFPEHVHSAPERGLVLTGDFQSGDRLLRAGDFYEAAAGTEHKRISSPSGCTGLLWVSATAWQRWSAAIGQ